MVPGAVGATSLAVTSNRIVARRSDGAVVGWPHEMPADVTRVRAFSLVDGLDRDHVCAVDWQGLLSCWNWHSDDRIEDRVEFADLGAVRAVARMADDSASILLEDGGV